MINEIYDYQEAGCVNAGILNVIQSPSTNIPV